MWVMESLPEWVLAPPVSRIHVRRRPQAVSFHLHPVGDPPRPGRTPGVHPDHRVHDRWPVRSHGDRAGPLNAAVHPDHALRRSVAPGAAEARTMAAHHSSGPGSAPPPGKSVTACASISPWMIRPSMVTSPTFNALVPRSKARMYESLPASPIVYMRARRRNRPTWRGLREAMEGGAAWT